MSAKEDEQVEKDDKDDAQEEEEESPPEMLRDPKQPIPSYIEVSIRMTLSAFVGYCLAYGELDNMIPSTQSWLIGMLAAIIVVRLPVVAAVPMALYLCMATVLTFALASVSALLCATTVSTGLFVGMSTVWAFWVSGLRYGDKTEKLTSAFAALNVVIFGLLGISQQPGVQDGVTIRISLGRVGQALGTTITSASELLSQLQGLDLSSVQLDGILDQLGQQLAHYAPLIQQVFGNLAEILQGDGSIKISEPPFAGHEAQVSVDDENMFVHIPGGLWLVKAFWVNDGGIDNPIRIYTNFMVVVGWIAVTLMVAPYLPPLRTMRFMLSRLTLPQLLKDTAWYMGHRHHDQSMEKSTEELMVRSRLVAEMGVIHEGTVAVLTGAEPRMLDNLGKLPRCTWLKLKEAIAASEIVALKALVVKEIVVDGCETVVDRAIDTCEKNANALSTKTKMKNEENDDSNKDTEEATRDPLQLEAACQRLTEATDAWLESLHPTETISFMDAGKAMLLNSATWGAAALLFLVRLGMLLLVPFLILTKRKTVDWTKVIECVKFTGGFTALVCMTVYWEAFRKYELDKTGGVDRDIEVVSDPPSSFAGWVLISYAFSTMGTTEGSLKKGILRLFGTACGGFSAWLMMRATKGNVFGNTAWLTVITYLGVYWSLDKNDKCRMGPSKDFSYFGFYWIITQVIVAMEYLGGGGSQTGDELVVNRIVSNCVGIAMSAVINIIPPQVLGNNPKWTRRMASKVRSATNDFCKMLLDGKSAEDVRKFCRKYDKAVTALHSDSKYLLEDAGRLSICPFYKIDPKLPKELTSLMVTATILTMVMGHAAYALDQDAAAFTNDSDIRSQLEGVQRNIQSNTSTKREAKLSGTDPEIIVQALELILVRLENHEARLATVQCGFLPRKGSQEEEVAKEASATDANQPASPEKPSEDHSSSLNRSINMEA